MAYSITNACNILILLLISSFAKGQDYHGHPSLEDYKKFQKDSAFFEWDVSMHKKFNGPNDSIEAIIFDSSLKEISDCHLSTHHLHSFSYDYTNNKIICVNGGDNDSFLKAKGIDMDDADTIHKGGKIYRVKKRTINHNGDL